MSKLMTTRYVLPLGATLIVSTWKNGEQQIEAVVDGTGVACGYIRSNQALSDMRPVVHAPETTTPANLAAFGEALSVMARLISTGKIDRGYAV